MDLNLTLLIIQSKQCLFVCHCVRQAPYLLPQEGHLWFYSCTVPNNDLDSDIHPCCDREHTDMLVEMFELGQLWNEYGLIGDVVVCPHFCFVSYSSRLLLWN